MVTHEEAVDQLSSYTFVKKSLWHDAPPSHHSPLLYIITIPKVYTAFTTHATHHQPYSVMGGDGWHVENYPLEF